MVIQHLCSAVLAGEGAFGALSWCCWQGTGSGQELLEAGSWHWQELNAGDSYKLLGDDSRKGFTQRRDFCFFL